MTRSPFSTPSAPSQISDMFAQSTAVLARPAPSTFERFERRGGTGQALMYVLLAAAVSGVIAALFSVFRSDVTFFGQLFSRLIGIPAQFLVFTGAVYLIGRYLFGGTGRYSEVAYTFALFFVPLSIVGTLLGIIPIFGWFVQSVVIALALAFFGFLAVQSSMNLRDPVKAGVTLVLSALAYSIVEPVLLRSLFGL